VFNIARKYYPVNGFVEIFYKNMTDGTDKRQVKRGLRMNAFAYSSHRSLNGAVAQ